MNFQVQYTETSKTPHIPKNTCSFLFFPFQTFRFPIETLPPTLLWGKVEANWTAPTVSSNGGAVMSLPSWQQRSLWRHEATAEKGKRKQPIERHCWTEGSSYCCCCCCCAPSARTTGRTAAPFLRRNCWEGLLRFASLRRMSQYATSFARFAQAAKDDDEGVGEEEGWSSMTA